MFDRQAELNRLAEKVWPLNEEHSFLPEREFALFGETEDDEQVSLLRILHDRGDEAALAALRVLAGEKSPAEVFAEESARYISRQQSEAGATISDRFALLDAYRDYVRSMGDSK